MGIKSQFETTEISAELELFNDDTKKDSGVENREMHLIKWNPLLTRFGEMGDLHCEIGFKKIGIET